MTGSVLVAGWVQPPAAGAATRLDVMRAAATYAASQGYYAGIAVVDTQTGRTYTSGHARHSFVSASVVKVLIATRLLVMDRMHGHIADLAYRMITQSDNDATDQLYPLAGGAGLEPWAERHYHVADLGSPSNQPSWWGYTRLTALGLARFYAKVKSDPKVAPWLLDAMRHIRRTSYVGEYQWWGLPSATTHAAVKQGWNIAFGHANVNTTGFVNRNRYAVAIMTRGPSRTYLGPISTMVTHVARLLLPNGHFPDPVPHVTRLSRTSAPVRGGWRVTLRGTSFTHVTRVMFGQRRGLDLDVGSPERLSVVAPPHAAGWVHIRVVTTHGTSSEVRADRFRYVGPPPSVTDAQASATAGSIEVTWTNPSITSFAGVKICRSTEDTSRSSSCKAIAKVAAPDESYSDSNLTAGTTYYYTLFSYDTVGQYSQGVMTVGTA
ncbi:MAG TPA: serine hydrolase [Jatrophihabitans sp.]|nr:serine hydrolase [Jatrophihabitans sp.]